LGFTELFKGIFRLRARYFCRQTKVPKNWLRNQWFLRIFFVQHSAFFLMSGTEMLSNCLQLLAPLPLIV